MHHQMEEDARFSIILPTFNEAENIAEMIESLERTYPSSSIIVVDDNSEDGTGNIVRSIAVGNDRVRLMIRDPKDRGLSASIFEGILSVKDDLFVVMDADFQHPPEAVGGLLKALTDGNDLVIGVRRARGPLSFVRRVSSWGADLLAAGYLMSRRQPHSHDNMSGFFGGRTAQCHQVIRDNFDQLERNGFKALFDILKFIPREASIAEVEFEFGDRAGGRSKLDSGVVLSILKQCGPVGRFSAMVARFLLTNRIGRLLATLFIGFLTTFAVAFLWDDVIWDSAMIGSTAVSLALALIYLTMASDLVFNTSSSSILFGLKMVGVGTMGYFINIIFISIFSPVLTSSQIIAPLMGLTIALGWEMLGHGVPQGRTAEDESV